MVLLLPSEEKQPENWELFGLALTERNLHFSIIGQRLRLLEVEVETASELQEQLVLDLMNLCFGKHFNT